MKKILCLFAFLPLFLSSCSSDSSDSPAAVTLVKTMIIDNADPADDDFNLLFSYSGNKLVNVKDSGVIIEQYIYSGERLTRINHPEDDTYIVIEYTGNQVSQYTEYDPDFNSATKTLITYSGNNFTRTVYFGDLTSQTTLSYTEVCTVQNGNITQMSRTSSFGFSSTENYTYDVKNNPFKNISNYTVFQVLDFDIEGNVNNVTDFTTSSRNDLTSYTYNSDDYPITEITRDMSNVLLESVSYTYY